MSRYLIEFKGNRRDQEVDADLIEDAGKDGTWIDFYKVPLIRSRRLIQRVRSADVSGIREVKRPRRS